MADTSINDQLQAVQTELKVPKGQTGRFGKHRNVEDIFEQLKPLLKKYSLNIVLDSEIVEIGGKNYVKATARVTNSGGSQIFATAYAWEGEISRGLDAPQVSGAAHSYARKYALGGLFAIDDGKDDPDRHTDAAPPPERTEAPARQGKYATAPQKYELRDMMKASGIEGEEQTDFVVSVINKERVSTVEDYEAVKKALQTKAEDAEEGETEDGQ